jgi:lysylphosphatidylglycerol synthetase-like protein (DUF2156 family)
LSEQGPSRPGGAVPGDRAALPPEEPGTVLQPTTHEEIPRAGAWAHLVGSLVPLAVGVASLVWATQLGVGSPTQPGPGLWPFAISVVLAASSVVLLVFGRGRREDYEKFTRGALTIALGVVSLGLFMVLFQRVGFELPTLLVLVFWLRFLGGESWRTTVLVAVGATAVFYVLFIVALGTPLPHIAFS